MTIRSYYHDAYTHTFSANIIERATDNGRFAVILDDTYFYPTSGGQPHDTGTINGVAVTAVTTREADDAVLHWLAQPLATDDVANGRIDWTRRFDHMQQHTGQHLLSQAFLRIAAAPTVGFHLTDSNLTIDLDTAVVSDAQLGQVETLVNQIIADNRPITVRFVSLAEAQQLTLRKLPDVSGDTLRLIDIEGFDLTACGGTHVASTASVGLLKITKVEKQKQKTRIEFCCGLRALADYQHKHDVATTLATILTTGTADLLPNITKMQADLRQAQRDVARLQTALLAYEAQALVQAAAVYDGWRLVTHVLADHAPPATLRPLAQALTSQPGVVALLALPGRKTQLLFARANDAPGDMHQLLQEALKQLDNGSGGGRPQMAQGGTAVLPRADLDAFLQQTAQMLVNSVGV